LIDRTEIRVKAGDGGNGAISFRREKFVPFGGPDGGDGGNGGDVVINAMDTVDSLRDFRRNRLYRGGKGKNGSGGRKHGKDGEKVALSVPPGSVIYVDDKEGTEVLRADLERAGDEVVVACGGKGGRGNVHYASSTNQAPRIAQRGEKGEERNVRIEMRLIADVGIIGYPNSGKSTLLDSASAAKPRIASYPFTTVEPVLGVVDVGMESFIMAEIPGLIEGAHTGRGLGHDFLRHAMRTKIFIHILNGTSESPLGYMMRINTELAMFDPDMARKPQLIALNKIDLTEVQERLKVLRDELHGSGVKAHYISAATGEGVGELMEATLNTLKTVEESERHEKQVLKVYRPQPREGRFEIKRVGDEFVLEAPDIERVYTGSGIKTGELRWQLNSQLKRMGVVKAMEKAGVKTGDRIRCGELTWEW
jgi:GTP-binding protein